MDDTYFEIRDRERPDVGPLAIASTHDQAMVALTTWTENFWRQLDANGEGGVGICLHLVVSEVGPHGPPVVCAVSEVGG